MKLALIFTIIFFSSLPAWARSDQKFQFIPRASYNMSRFEVGSSATASYSGIGYGADVVLKFGNELYGVSILGGYSTLDLDNSANTSTQRESISGSVINIGSRFYGANLFIGLSLAYASFTNDYFGINTSKTNYTGLGVRLETGIDIKMGKGFVFTPKLNYDILDVSPETSVSTEKRFKNFGAGLGIGLEF